MKLKILQEKYGSDDNNDSINKKNILQVLDDLIEKEKINLDKSKLRNDKISQYFTEGVIAGLKKASREIIGGN